MPREKSLNKEVVSNDAMEIFWKKGFYQTSIQDLVQHIGINRTSLYDTYSDKENLYKESFKLYRNQLSDKIQFIFKKSNTIQEGFDDFTDYFIFELLDKKNGCFITNSFSELLPCKNMDFKQLLEETRQIFQNQIFYFLNEGKKNNEIKDDINVEEASINFYTILAGSATISKTDIKKEEIIKSINFFKKSIFLKAK